MCDKKANHTQSILLSFLFSLKFFVLKCEKWKNEWKKWNEMKRGRRRRKKRKFLLFQSLFTSPIFFQKAEKSMLLTRSRLFVFKPVSFALPFKGVKLYVNLQNSWILFLVIRLLQPRQNRKFQAKRETQKSFNIEIPKPHLDLLFSNSICEIKEANKKKSWHVTRNFFRRGSDEGGKIL